jgi:UDPglucose 6-dehydrogenase
MSFEQLWSQLERDHDAVDGVIEPEELKVLSWVPGEPEPMFLSVLCATRRDYNGEVVDVRTKMGRRLTTTADHPWLVSDGFGAFPERKLAGELAVSDWVPLAMGGASDWDATSTASLLTAVEAAEIDPEQLIVRPAREEVERVAALPMLARREVFARSGSAAARTGEIRRTGTLRLDEAWRGDVTLSGATLGTTKNGTHASSTIAIDEDFWRVVGLYLAEGCTTADGDRRRIQWSFHPTREQHLVDEVVEFWARHNVRANVNRTPTARVVRVSSRLLAAWWTKVLGLGRSSYEQRLPDLIWERPEGDRWALLSGLFEGDGSWSLIGGGPSVIIEMGTVSDELADGVLRLLASVGIVASRRLGRSAKSTKDTHWIRISGADQVERAIRLVPERDRPGVLASIARQRKRIAPTGYRRFGDGTAWVRVAQVARRHFHGPTYSLEVPYAHTFVTTSGLSLSNCFPKDVSALKQLAGNSGYHFQLLTAVIEVNELQKRRVIAKLQKHLGTLVGKKIALLGLAFKADTDDMREASSLVLAARLQGEGAVVRAYDPIAAEQARRLMPGVEMAGSVMEAVAGSDAIVLVTEWPEFATLDWSEVAAATRGRLIVDGRNFMDGAAARAVGFTYEGIGR